MQNILTCFIEIARKGCVLKWGIAHVQQESRFNNLKAKKKCNRKSLAQKFKAVYNKTQYNELKQHFTLY